MSIEAPYSKFNINGFKLYILVSLIAAGWLTYDGYFSKYEWSPNHKFYKEHVIDNEGVADSTMQFNKYGPFFLIVLAGYFGFRWNSVKDIKIVGDDNGLDTGKEVIAYDNIEKIDKTYFKEKGYFVITHKNKDGNEKDVRLSHKTYDNLEALLELIVSKIT